MSTPSEELTIDKDAVVKCSQQSSMALQYTHQLLEKTIVCTMNDGRTVRGTFLCIDRLSNIILTNNVVEERTIELADYRQHNSNRSSNKNNCQTLSCKRVLAQAMIPGSRLVKVEVEQSIHEQIMNSLSNL
jgi:small nuclear ribonucleoprotein (snRNP)-like protein